MRFSRSSVKQSFIAASAILLAMTISLFAISPAGTASASPTRQSATPFLTLPFEPNGNMEVLSGWYYNGGGYHGGIDFINGNYNGLGSWRTFPVIAAADGEACGNCSSRQGNAVFVQHHVGGVTYYTYYGHLA